MGEAGVGVRFDNAGLAEALGLSALVLILAEGGLTTSWARARAAAPAALSLATAGVVVSAVVVAAAARWLLGLGWREALLLGTVLAPTDAAAVFAVLRKLPLPPQLSGTLEGESGLNDPPAVLTVTLLSDIGHHPPSPALIADEIAWQLAAGAAIGVLAGAAGALVLRRVALPASGLYPIAILALIVAGYGAATPDAERAQVRLLLPDERREAAPAAGLTIRETQTIKRPTGNQPATSQPLTLRLDNLTRGQSSSVEDSLGFDVDGDLVADHDTATFEGGVPAHPEVLPVDHAGGGETHTGASVRSGPIPPSSTLSVTGLVMSRMVRSPATM